MQRAREGFLPIYALPKNVQVNIFFSVPSPARGALEKGVRKRGLKMSDSGGPVEEVVGL